jgi:methylmalonyl-CoA mutase
MDAGGERGATNGDVLAASHRFEVDHGRRPRILIASTVGDGDERAARGVAAGFAGMGFDVDVGPIAASLATVAGQAVDADVHAIVWHDVTAHQLEALRDALADAGRPDIVVCALGPNDAAEPALALSLLLRLADAQ